MKGINNRLVALCIAILCFSATTGAAPLLPIQTPTINLGYEIHQGTVNETGDYYIFKNIPYAEQPVGALRFQKPAHIEKRGAEINTGAQDVICYQALPGWEASRSKADQKLLRQRAADAEEPVATESCLVLDLRVPAEVFRKGRAAKVPVMVWIHGGGFVRGSKTSEGDPAGLITRSMIGGQDGMIVISINYRLGMFGWLAADGVTPNLGIYDQRVALEWVKRYVGRFGGDPDRVTVAGESAGGASVVHHITAFGGENDPTPFRAAIPMSPAWQFSIDVDKSYQVTLAAASNVTGTSITDIDALRNLNSTQLEQINQAAVFVADYGQFTYGPTTDDSLVPNHPQVLLHDGKFHRNVDVMTSHVRNESATFIPTTLKTSSDVKAALKNNLPEASDSTIDTLLTDIYPAVSDGRKLWETEFARAAQMDSELFFACITRYLAVANGNATHNYLFAVPPGFHADDIKYVFFNGDTGTGDDGLEVHADMAIALQDYIAAFVMTGDPNTAAQPPFPMYGEDGTVIKFSDKGITTQVDDLKNGRCEWLQQAMVDGLL
ncbi:carboxylesterase [Poronia punctata]|nr:carboxylesterase [Poronia punctata]